MAEGVRDFETKFKEALAWLVRERFPNIADQVYEVTNFEEESRDTGGCPTCGPYYEHTVDVWYLTAEGASGLVTITGRLSELLPALGDYPGWSE